MARREQLRDLEVLDDTVGQAGDDEDNVHDDLDGVLLIELDSRNCVSFKQDKETMRTASSTR